MNNQHLLRNYSLPNLIAEQHEDLDEDFVNDFLFTLESPQEIQCFI